MIILSVDPGIARTGYAILSAIKGSNPKLIDYGCIETSPKATIALRLSLLQRKFNRIIKKYKPQAIILEQLFFNTNQKTIIQIAQAQGVLLSSAYASGVFIEFITPIQIKQAITGYGRADKKQVQKMTQILLNIKKDIKPDDIIDAIACGLTYCTIKRF